MSNLPSMDPSLTWKTQFKTPSRRVILKDIFLTVIVLGFIIGITFNFRRSHNADGYDSIIPPGHSDQDSGWDTPQTPSIQGGSYCPEATLNVSDGMPVYHFKSGKTLGIHQRNDHLHRSSGFAYVRTLGMIVIRHIPENSKDKETGYVTFETWVSERELPFGFEWNQKTQDLVVTTPRFSSMPRQRPHCQSLTVTVWLPAKVTFKNVQIHASQLSIKVLDDVNVRISDSSHIVSNTGDIEFPSRKDYIIDRPSVQQYDRSKVSTQVSPVDSHELSRSGFSSRETYIVTQSGSVLGTYPLYDVLSIESSSGSFEITVSPQHILKSDPKPAQLDLSTNSGSIQVRCPIRQSDSIPKRDYRTSVKTISGSIEGDFIIGTQARFKTTSGSLHNLVVLPTDPIDKSALSTDTTSGSTHITVLSPLSWPSVSSSRGGRLPEHIQDGENVPYLVRPKDFSNTKSIEPHLGRSQTVLRNLTSSHRGYSGSIELHYPAEWEGEVTAQTTSGSIEISGEGVRVIRDGRRDWYHRETTAVKGPSPHHGSHATIDSSSGSVEIRIG